MARGFFIISFYKGTHIISFTQLKNEANIKAKAFSFVEYILTNIGLLEHGEISNLDSIINSNNHLSINLIVEKIIDGKLGIKSCINLISPSDIAEETIKILNDLLTEKLTQDVNRICSRDITKFSHYFLIPIERFIKH